MKTSVLHSAFLALLSLLLSPIAVVHASPAPADSVHFCLPVDFEQWARDRARPAAKRLADLNVGEPRTVRLIYFLPNDRPYRADVVQKMKDEIRQIQTFYAEQMQAQGYGDRTFRFETDAQGEPLVHRVDGQHPDSHYLDDTSGTVFAEIDRTFDVGQNIYFIVIDNTTHAITVGGSSVGGVADSYGKNGGVSILPEEFRFELAAHELAHAFGLTWHDFRSNAYILSYGYYADQLSSCHAEFLAVHPYFNLDIPIEEGSPPTIELLSPVRFQFGSKSVSIRVEISDSEGLHQAQLFNTTRGLLQGPADGFYEVRDCRGLAGEAEAVVEFDFSDRLPSYFEHPLQVKAVDMDGNVGTTYFTLTGISPQYIGSLEGHGDGVYSVTFAPGGTILASGSWDGTVKLWDLATETNTATLEGHGGGVASVAFSPDESTLASGSWDGTVKLWDLATGTDTATLEGHGDGVASVAFSPSGAMLASGSRDGTVKLWDLATGTDTATLEGHGDGVASVAFSPSGAMLASGSRDGTVKLWEVATETNTATLEGHADRITSVAFAPGGATLASGSEDGTIRLWDVDTGSDTAILKRHSATSVVFSPDGATLASVSRDGTVRLWDVVAGTDIPPRLREDGSGIHSATFSPDGTTLATGSENHAVQLWDTSEWKRPRPYSLERISGDGQQAAPGAALANPHVVEVRDQYGLPLPGVVVTFTVTAGGGRLSGRSDAETATTDTRGRAERTLTLGPTAGMNTVEVSVPGLEPMTFDALGVGTIAPREGDFRTWHLPENAIARLGKGRLSTGERVGAFSPDGQSLAVVSSIGIWLYEVATFRPLALFPTGENRFGSVAFSPDGTMLASTPEDQETETRLWDIATGEVIATLEGHTASPVVFSPDGRIVAVGLWDGTIKLWDVATGQIKAILEEEGDTNGIQAVAFSPDGTLLASGTGNGTLRLWDVGTGTRTATLVEYGGGIESVVFSSDGTILASASRWDNTVKVWDLATGNAATISGHTDNVNTVAFSPDGTTLASGGGGTYGGYHDAINLWETATGAHTAILDAHRTPIHFLAFLPDGTTLVSGAWRTIKVWDVATRTSAATLSGEVIRSVSPDGTTLAMGREDGTVDLLEVSTGTSVAILEGHGDWAGSVAFSPDGATLATGTEDDGTVKLWEVATGTNTANLEGHEHGVFSLAFSPDGATLASGGGYVVKLWDVGTGTNYATLKGHEYVVSSVRFSMDGTILASGSWDRTVSLWDVVRETRIATLEGHTAWVNSVAFSPDGATLASGASDGTVLLWDMQLLLPHPRTLTKLSGDEQQGPAGGALGKPFVVSALDQNGEPFAGAVVTFVVTTGGGTLSAATATTDAKGQAASILTLGSQPGPNTVVVTVADLEPEIFTAVAETTPDFDGDGVTNFADFFLFADAFGGSDPRFDLDGSGAVDFADFFLFVDAFDQPAQAKLLVLAQELIGLPDGPQLQQNAPNPFNRQTVISYFLLAPGPARLELFALTGQRVAVLSEGQRKAGRHRLHWDGRDDAGRPLASGIYLYRLVTGEGVLTRKLILLR